MVDHKALAWETSINLWIHYESGLLKTLFHIVGGLILKCVNFEIYIV